VNELIPFKDTLQGIVRSSLGGFERRGYFPRPTALPDASVTYAATVLTVHLAELFLRLLVSFVIGVLIWMLIGSNLVWFSRLLYFVMGFGHVVDFGRTLKYFRMLPNPSSPLPRSQIQADQSGTASEAISDDQVSPAETQSQADSSEPQSLDATSEAVVSSTPASTAELSQSDSETTEPDAEQVDANAAVPEEGTPEVDDQSPNTLSDASTPHAEPPPVVVEFKSFEEPIDTPESLSEKVVTTPNAQIAANSGDEIKLVRFKDKVTTLLLKESNT
jgi:hypothetical protein